MECLMLVNTEKEYDNYYGSGTNLKKAIKEFGIESKCRNI